MVRITKDMLGKLSKPRREEFLKRRNEILKDIRFAPVLLQLITCSMYFLILSMIILPLWKIAFGQEIFAVLGLTCLNVVRVMPLMAAVAFIVDLVIILSYLAKIEKLNREYFKVEVKARKVND